MQLAEVLNDHRSERFTENPLSLLGKHHERNIAFFI
jgi:hypothetical protein